MYLEIVAKHPVETDHLKHKDIVFICRMKNNRHFVGHQIEIANHEKNIDATLQSVTNRSINMKKDNTEKVLDGYPVQHH